MADILRESEGLMKASNANSSRNYMRPRLHAWAFLKYRDWGSPHPEGQLQKEMGKLSHPFIYSADTCWAPKCCGRANHTQSHSLANSFHQTLSGHLPHARHCSTAVHIQRDELTGPSHQLLIHLDALGTVRAVGTE